MEENSEVGTSTFPKEIVKFLSSPGCHSLILRGMAGTGKTTLALQMIEELAQLQQSYYMSTRVSDHSLFNQFPWLMDKVKELSGNVVKNLVDFNDNILKQLKLDENDMVQKVQKQAKDFLKQAGLLEEEFEDEDYY